MGGGGGQALARDQGTGDAAVVRTGGAILWDRTARDFDWGATTALPPALRGRFRDEPLHVDLTGLGERADDLTLHDTRFAGAVLRLAATLHDRPADELNVQAVRELRRRLRVAYGGAGLILVLAAAAVIAALGFRQQRDVADASSRRARPPGSGAGCRFAPSRWSRPSARRCGDLATLGPEVRAVFVRQMADDPAWRLADRPALTLALKLAQRPEPVLRALGLRPGPGQTAEDLAALLLDDIPKAPYPNEMQTLAGAARALSPRLPPDKVRAATAAVLGAFVATDDPFALRSATLALRALPVPAVTRRDPGVVGPVLYGLEHAADPDAATALAQALQALAPDLDDGQAKAALAAVLAALGRASDPRPWTPWPRRPAPCRR